MDCINKAEKNGQKLTVVYGDCTLGVRGSTGGKSFHYIFPTRPGGRSPLTLMAGNGFIVPRSQHSGGRLRIMTGEAAFI